MVQQRLVDSGFSGANIRNLFVKMGGNVPIRELAMRVVADRLISDEVLEKCQLTGVMKICRDSLKAELGPDETPLAQPIGDEDGTWMQLSLFTYSMLCDLIERRSQNITDDYMKLLRIHRYCLRKFRKAPEIPQLREIEPA